MVLAPATLRIIAATRKAAPRPTRALERLMRPIEQPRDQALPLRPLRRLRRLFQGLRLLDTVLLLQRQPFLQAHAGAGGPLRLVGPLSLGQFSRHRVLMHRARVLAATAPGSKSAAPIVAACATRPHCAKPGAGRIRLPGDP